MRDTSVLHPDLQDLITKLKKKCEAEGLKIGIGECFRSVAEQDALYAQGRTTTGSIVTNVKGSTYSSMHQWYVAFDFYRNDGKGAYYNNDGFFDKVGKIGQSLGLEWGGGWKSPVDKPHFQLPNWGSTTSKLKNIYGNPDAFKKSWNKAATTTTTTSKPAATPAAPAKTEDDYVNDLVKAYKKASDAEYTAFVKGVRSALGCKVDGKANPTLLSKTPTINSKKNINHKIVKPLQTYLKAMGLYTGAIDGIAGQKCFRAIKAFQKKVVALSKPDGELTAGGKSWRKLLRLQ